MKKSELYLINGFLGAGKTTFLKALLDIIFDKKVGIIENEFGKEGIDGILLKREGYQVSEINNGSIFCVCRSDMFIDALLDLYDRGIDIIIVESSGLADPTEMPEILGIIKKIRGDLFKYKGSITIVDAVNFHKVLDTAIVVKNQIISADIVYINKIDLISKEKLPEIEGLIHSINPNTKIIQTTFGKIEQPEIVLSLNHSFDQDEDIYRVKIINNQKISLIIDGDYDKTIFINWLKEIAPFTHRIKGFVRLNKDMYFVDTVNEDVKFYNIDQCESTKIVLVILGNGKKSLKRIIQSSWKQYFHTEYILEY